MIVSHGIDPALLDVLSQGLGGEIAPKLHPKP
jgi:hypothetical protein